MNAVRNVDGIGATVSGGELDPAGKIYVREPAQVGPIIEPPDPDGGGYRGQATGPGRPPGFPDTAAPSDHPPGDHLSDDQPRGDPGPDDDDIPPF